jgi:hypothetical protein
MGTEKRRAGAEGLEKDCKAAKEPSISWQLTYWHTITYAKFSFEI